jgi:ribosome biogenesis GTPase A
MEYPDVAFYLTNYLVKHYPDSLLSRYELDHLPDVELELLELIGNKRGCLRSGGTIDLEKVSRLFLMEYRAGTLGQISLETPEDKILELKELAILREKKLARKAAREALRKKKKRK